AAGAAGAVGLLTGCAWWRPDPSPPPPDPLTPLVATATALVAAYDRTIAAHPDLSPLLSPVRDAHAAHATALAEMIDQPPGTTAAHLDLPPRLSPGRAAHAAHATALAEMIDQPPATTAAAWVPPAPRTVPPEPDRALATLREAEQAAYDEAAQACLAAPAVRAAALGSVCAAIATHLEVLR